MPAIVSRFEVRAVRAEQNLNGPIRSKFSEAQTHNGALEAVDNVAGSTISYKVRSSAGRAVRLGQFLNQSLPFVEYGYSATSPPIFRLFLPRHQVQQFFVAVPAVGRACGGHRLLQMLTSLPL